MTDCNRPWLIYFWPDVKWPMYASPAIVLVLYFVLAWEIRRHCEKVMTCKRYCHSNRSRELFINKCIYFQLFVNIIEWIVIKRN